jgi:hypothetical protein
MRIVKSRVVGGGNSSEGKRSGRPLPPLAGEAPDGGADCLFFFLTRGPLGSASYHHDFLLLNEHTHVVIHLP